MKHLFNKDLFDVMPLGISQSPRFALVKYGGGIIQMSGSIAGNTFARNRYGNYVRAKTMPINPNTALQVLVRASVAFLTTRWAQTLTASQRTAWNLYADSVNMKNKLGEVIKLSGFNHYIRSNSNITRLGSASIDDGPSIFELPAQDATMTVTASEATQMYSVSFDITQDWVNEDGARLIIFTGLPQNAQRNFFAGPWRLQGLVLGNNASPPTSPATVAAGYPISELQRVWVYARIIRADGRLSEKFTANTFCAA